MRDTAAEQSCHLLTLRHLLAAASEASMGAEAMLGESGSLGPFPTKGDPQQAGFPALDQQLGASETGAPGKAWVPAACSSACPGDTESRCSEPRAACRARARQIYGALGGV